MHEVGFEPTQLTLPDLKSGSLDHSDIDAVCKPPLVVVYACEIEVKK